MSEENPSSSNVAAASSSSANSSSHAAEPPAASEMDHFTSLQEMQLEHRSLLQASRGCKGDGQLLDRVIAFLSRGERTGVILDTPDDRSTAQSMLDYWTSTLYTLFQSARGSVSRSNPSLSFTSTRSADPSGLTRMIADPVLAEFNTETVEKVAQRAEAAVAAMGALEQETARRLLLRLVRLRTDGKRFELLTAERFALEAMDDPARAKRVLNTLIESQAVKCKPAEKPACDDCALAYESLTRIWDRLSEWLEQRARFRDAVEYWERTGHHDAALIRGNLLGQTLSYHDLNGPERQFIDASRHGESRRTRRTQIAAVSFGIIALFAIIAAVVAGIQFNRVRKAENNERALYNVLDARQKLINMALVTRTMAELATARYDAEEEVAHQRWKVFAANLEQDPFFKGYVSQSNAVLADLGQGKAARQNLNALTHTTVGLGRRLRDEARRSDDAGINAAMCSMRYAAYDTAKLCANRISEMLASQPYANAEPFIHEFWVLYWGEMVIVEGSDVEAAMVDYGSVLQDIDNSLQPTEQQKKLIESSLQQADLRNTSTNTNTIPRPRPTPNLLYRNIPNQYQQLSGVASRGELPGPVLDVIKKLSTQKAAPDQTRRLRDARDKLIATLDKGLNAPTITD